VADRAAGGALVSIGIGLIVEGQTEVAFTPHLRRFLESRLAGKMPRLRFSLQHGRIPKGDALARLVRNMLNDPKLDLHAVIALTDVYTGTQDFTDAADAKAKMMAWVQHERFYPHAAQYDFEAWLLPYWERIRELARSSAAKPGNDPEQVNHQNPPAHRLRAIFRASSRWGYVKPREAGRILDGQDLTIAANTCPELKAFLNTILRLSGGEPLA
jgi:hypothetical protein